MKLIIFDLETQFLFQELPRGWQDAELMRVSILGFTKIDWTNRSINAFYTDVVRENELPDFFRVVETSGVLIGWNNENWNRVLKPYDKKGVVEHITSVDLKVLTHQNSNGSKISLMALGKALGIKKLGTNGFEAVDHFRKGEFFDLSRFVLRDHEIIKFYLNKIMNSGEGSTLLVQDTDDKQVGIKISEIKKSIDEKLRMKDNQYGLHED